MYALSFFQVLFLSVIEQHSIPEWAQLYFSWILTCVSSWKQCKKWFPDITSFLWNWELQGFVTEIRSCQTCASECLCNNLLTPHVLYLFAGPSAGTWLPVNPLQKDAHLGLRESLIPELPSPDVVHSLQMQLSWSRRWEVAWEKRY